MYVSIRIIKLPFIPSSPILNPPILTPSIPKKSSNKDVAYFSPIPSQPLPAWMKNNYAIPLMPTKSSPGTAIRKFNPCSKRAALDAMAIAAAPSPSLINTITSVIISATLNAISYANEPPKCSINATPSLSPPNKSSSYFHIYIYMKKHTHSFFYHRAKKSDLG